MATSIGHRWMTISVVQLSLLGLLCGVAPSSHVVHGDDVVTGDGHATENAGGAEGLTFQFASSSWADVLGWVSREADVVVDYASLPESEVNLVNGGQRLYSGEEALDLFLDILVDHGYGFVRRDRRVTILDLNDAGNRSRAASIASVVRESELADQPRGALVACVLDLSSIRAQINVRTNGKESSWRRSLSPASSIDMDSGAHRSVVVDSAEKVRGLLIKLSAIDKPMVRVPIVNRNAAEILKELEPLNRSASSNGRSPRPPNGNRNGSPGSSSVKLGLGDQGMSILISGTPEASQPIKEMIRQLDTQDPAKRIVDAISLVGLNVDTIRDDILALMDVTSSRSSGNARERRDGVDRRRSSANDLRPPTLVVHRGVNQLWFSGNVWQHEQVREIVEAMRAKGTSPVSDRVRVIAQNTQRVRQAIDAARQIWGVGGQLSEIVVQNADATDMTTVSARPTELSMSRLEVPAGDIDVRYEEDRVIMASSNAVALEQFYDVVRSMLGVLPRSSSEVFTTAYRTPSELVNEIRAIIKPIEKSGASPLDPPNGALTMDDSKKPSTPVSENPSKRNRRSRNGQRAAQPHTNASQASSEGFVSSIHDASSAEPSLELVPLDLSHQILAQGTVEEIDRVRRLLLMLDIPSNEKPLPELVSLKARTADECVQYLKLTFGDRVAVVPSTSSIDSLPPLPYVMVDQSTDSLFIVAESSQRSQIQSAIVTFDKAATASGDRIEVVTFGTPAVAEAFARLFSSSSDGRSGEPRARPAAEAVDDDDDAERRRPVPSQRFSTGDVSRTRGDDGPGDAGDDRRRNGR